MENVELNKKINLSDLHEGDIFYGYVIDSSEIEVVKWLFVKTTEHGAYFISCKTTEMMEFFVSTEHCLRKNPLERRNSIDNLFIFLDSGSAYSYAKQLVLLEQLKYKPLSTKDLTQLENIVW